MKNKLIWPQGFDYFKLKDKKSFLVIGDFMIDEYIPVELKRLSPEDPIPILKEAGKRKRYPGGALNVAYQVSRFASDLKVLGYVDQDTRELLNDYRIGYMEMSEGENCLVPRKHRFVHGNKTVVRHDRELDYYGLDEVKMRTQACLAEERVIKENKHYDVIFFSDYGKGTLSLGGFGNLIWGGEYWDSIKLLDPKGVKDISHWYGIDYVKANYNEAQQLVPEKDRQSQCEMLIKKFKCRGVVVTCGGHGYYGMSGESGYFEFLSQEMDGYYVEPWLEKKLLSPVSSPNVAGAGDCFFAFMGVGLAAGMDLSQACWFAYQVGRMYVKQLERRCFSLADLLVGHVVDKDILKERDFSLVFTNGCFDMLHAGHISCLEYAKKHGERLVVGLNSDESVRRLKGAGKPVQSVQYRAEALLALDCVDYVCVFEEDTPEELVKAIRPEVLVKGEEYAGGEVAGKEYADLVLFCPMKGEVSTTKILETYTSGK